MKNLSKKLLIASVSALILGATGCGRFSKDIDSQQVLVMDLGENDVPPIDISSDEPIENSELVFILNNPVVGSAVVSIQDLLGDSGRGAQFSEARILSGLESATLFSSSRSGLIDSIKVVVKPGYSGALSLRVSIKLDDGRLVTRLVEGRISLPPRPSPVPTSVPTTRR